MGKASNRLRLCKHYWTDSIASLAIPLPSTQSRRAAAAGWPKEAQNQKKGTGATASCQRLEPHPLGVRVLSSPFVPFVQFPRFRLRSFTAETRRAQSHCSGPSPRNSAAPAISAVNPFPPHPSRVSLWGGKARQRAGMPAVPGGPRTRGARPSEGLVPPKSSSLHAIRRQRAATAAPSTMRSDQ